MKHLPILIFLLAGCNPTENCNLKALRKFDSITADQITTLNAYNKLLFSLPTDTIIDYSNAHTSIDEGLPDLIKRSTDQFFIVGATPEMAGLQHRFDSVYLNNIDRSRYGSNGIEFVYFRPIDSTVQLHIFSTICKNSVVSHYLVFQKTLGRPLNMDFEAILQVRDLSEGWKYIIATDEYRGM